MRLKTFERFLREEYLNPDIKLLSQETKQGKSISIWSITLRQATTGHAVVTIARAEGIELGVLMAMKDYMRMKLEMAGHEAETIEEALRTLVDKWVDETVDTVEMRHMARDVRG